MDESSALIKEFAIKQLRETYPDRKNTKIDINNYFLAKAGIKMEFKEDLKKESQSMYLIK